MVSFSSLFLSQFRKWLWIKDCCVLGANSLDLWKFDLYKSHNSFQEFTTRTCSRPLWKSRDVSNIPICSLWIPTISSELMIIQAFKNINWALHNNIVKCKPSKTPNRHLNETRKIKSNETFLKKGSNQSIMHWTIKKSRSNTRNKQLTAHKKINKISMKCSKS